MGELPGGKVHTRGPPSPLTREEAGAERADDPRDYSGHLMKEAKEQVTAEGKSLRECLTTVCRKSGKLPMSTELLAVARGEELQGGTMEPLRSTSQSLASAEGDQQAGGRTGEKVRELREKAKRNRGGAGQ